MDSTITISALVNIVLIILGIAVGIFLIILIYNLSQTLKKINTMLDQNGGAISGTMKNVDVITKNVSDITQNFQKTSQQIDKTAPDAIENVGEIILSTKNAVKSTENIVGKVEETVVTVGDDIMDTTDAIRTNTEDVLGYIKIISEVIKAVTAAFSKK